jgi:hypothetical protein
VPRRLAVRATPRTLRLDSTERPPDRLPWTGSVTSVTSTAMTGSATQRTSHYDPAADRSFQRGDGNPPHRRGRPGARRHSVAPGVATDPGPRFGVRRPCPGTSSARCPRPLEGHAGRRAARTRGSRGRPQEGRAGRSAAPGRAARRRALGGHGRRKFMCRPEVGRGV